MAMTELFFAHRGRCSDKWEGYLDAYEAEFTPIRLRGKPIDLMEIGVQEGGSLEIWQKAFPPGSRIAGLDIDPRVGDMAFPAGIEVVVGDATSAAVLAAAFPGRQFDVVIDDGSHGCADVLATFGALFPRVQPGGLYVIEDLHCSYWPSYGGGFRRPGSSIEWLKALVDTVNADHWSAADGTEDDQALRDIYGPWVERVTFYDSMVVVAKRKRVQTRRQRRMLTGAAENHSGNLAGVAAAFVERPDSFAFGADYAGLVAAEIVRQGGAIGTANPAHYVHHTSPALPAPNPALDVVLQEMIDHVTAQPERFRPSRFWNHFDERNSAQLRGMGLERFKRTVNQNYFNWMMTGSDDNQFRAAAKAWARNPDMDAFRVQLDGGEELDGFFTDNPLATEEGRELYCAFVGMLWQHTRTEVPNGLCDALTEPALGDPIPTTLHGRAISQDLANSIRERNAILAPFEERLGQGWRPTIVELGAGYGRLGFVLLCSAPCRYVVVDIPPALHISQWYLTSVLPGKTAFRFRPWASFDAVAAELRGADMAFLTPDQFALLPAGLFDVGIAISNLAEMTREQCDMYLDLFDHTVREAVYIKQWVAQSNPLDGVDFVRSNFDMNPAWQPVINRLDALQDLFFETLWMRKQE